MAPAINRSDLTGKGGNSCHRFFRKLKNIATLAYATSAFWVLLIPLFIGVTGADLGCPAMAL